MSAKKENKSKKTTKKKTSTSAKKQTTPSKKPAKRPTTDEVKIYIKTLTNSINSRGKKYYKEPRFDKTIPVTKVIEKLNISIEDIFREGVDCNIAIGTKIGNGKHVFLLHEDILTFLATPDIPLSSKDIRWAFKEIHVSGKGYKLVDVMPHMDLPSYDISINTLCITEEGYNYLKKKLKRKKSSSKAVLSSSKTTDKPKKGKLSKGKGYRIPKEIFYETLKKAYTYCKEKETKGGEKMSGVRIAKYAIKVLKLRFGDEYDADFDQGYLENLISKIKHGELE
jgi:hypothetical protein